MSENAAGQTTQYSLTHEPVHISTRNTKGLKLARTDDSPPPDNRKCLLSEGCFHVVTFRQSILTSIDVLQHYSVQSLYYQRLG